MSIFDRIYLGATPGDGTGDEAHEAFGKVNDMMAYLEDMFARSKTMNGFDRDNEDTLGVLQYCHDSSGGVVHQINADGSYEKLTGQTKFIDGSTNLADRTLVQFHSPGQTSFKFWHQGTLHAVTDMPQIQLPDDSASNFVAYKSDGTLVLQSDPKAAIVDNVLVTLVEQNAITSILNYYADERHGFVMDGQTHLRLHQGRNSGYAWMGGFEISGLVNNGTTFSGLTAGRSGDEDVPTDVDAVTQAPHLYRLGANGEYTFSDYSNKLGLFDGGKCVYNEFDGSTWKLSEINADYIIQTMFQSNNKLHPNFWVVGQYLHANRGTARDHLMANVTELQLDRIISPETYPMYSCIIHKEAYGQIEKGENGEIYVDHRWGYPVMRF